MRRNIAALVSIAFLLNACGDTRLERTGSGAVAGAVSGAAIGFVCCQRAGEGAAPGLFIGMAVGALIGLMLDEPLFFNPDRR